jgi:hypothetical protein
MMVIRPNEIPNRKREDTDQNRSTPKEKKENTVRVNRITLKNERDFD